MEPTSFHTGPNKSRGQIHGAAAAAGGDDDTRVDSAFLISTVILKKKKTHTLTWRIVFGQKWQVLKEM